MTLENINNIEQLLRLGLKLQTALRVQQVMRKSTICNKTSSQDSRR